MESGGKKKSEPVLEEQNLGSLEFFDVITRNKHAG